MSKKILVIEDEKNIRENLVELLELSGYDVFSAENGIEGVKSARQNIPDLIICDVMMPEMDGYGVLHALSKDLNLVQTPFIFLTAKAGNEDLRKGMRYGADDYITKPFEASDLLSSIETRLKKKDLLKEKYNADYSGLQDLIEDTKEVVNLESVLDSSNVIKGKKRDAIYREGAYPKEIYYVQKGRIKNTRMNEDGKELIAEVWQAGDFFGVIPAMNETSYTHSAVAAEDYKITAIPINEFKKLLTTNLEIANKFMRIFAGNIEAKELELLEIAYGTVRTRLADALLRLAETYSDRVNEGIPLSREELAQFVGTAPETLIRTVKDFKEEGLISMNKTKIIPNVQKLELMKY